MPCDLRAVVRANRLGFEDALRAAVERKREQHLRLGAKKKRKPAAGGKGAAKKKKNAAKGGAAAAGASSSSTRAAAAAAAAPPPAPAPLPRVSLLLHGTRGDLVPHILRESHRGRNAAHLRLALPGPAAAGARTFFRGGSEAEMAWFTRVPEVAASYAALRERQGGRLGYDQEPAELALVRTNNEEDDAAPQRMLTVFF